MVSVSPSNMNNFDQSESQRDQPPQQPQADCDSSTVSSRSSEFYTSASSSSSQLSSSQQVIKQDNRSTSRNYSYVSSRNKNKFKPEVVEDESFNISYSNNNSFNDRNDNYQNNNNTFSNNSNTSDNINNNNNNDNNFNNNHNRNNVEHRSIIARRFKTKLCEKFLQSGVCNYSWKCMFAHGLDEIRSAEENERDGLTTEDALKDFQRNLMHITAKNNTKVSNGNFNPFNKSFERKKNFVNNISFDKNCATGPDNLTQNYNSINKVDPVFPIGSSTDYSKIIFANANRSESDLIQFNPYRSVSSPTFPSPSPSGTVFSSFVSSNHPASGSTSDSSIFAYNNNTNSNINSSFNNSSFNAPHKTHNNPYLTGSVKFKK